MRTQMGRDVSRLEVAECATGPTSDLGVPLLRPKAWRSPLQRASPDFPEVSPQDGARADGSSFSASASSSSMLMSTFYAKEEDVVPVPDWHRDV